MFGVKTEIEDLKSYVIALKHSVDELHCRISSVKCSKETNNAAAVNMQYRLDQIYDLLADMTKKTAEKPKKRRSSRKKADASD